MVQILELWLILTTRFTEGVQERSERRRKEGRWFWSLCSSMATLAFTRALLPADKLRAERGPVSDKEQRLRFYTTCCDAASRAPSDGTRMRDTSPARNP